MIARAHKHIKRSPPSDFQRWRLLFAWTYFHPVWNTSTLRCIWSRWALVADSDGLANVCLFQQFSRSMHIYWLPRLWKMWIDFMCAFCNFRFLYVWHVPGFDVAERLKNPPRSWFVILMILPLKSLSLPIAWDTAYIENDRFLQTPSVMSRRTRAAYLHMTWYGHLWSGRPACHT